MYGDLQGQALLSGLLGSLELGWLVLVERIDTRSSFENAANSTIPTRRAHRVVDWKDSFRPVSFWILAKQVRNETAWSNEPLNILQEEASNQDGILGSKKLCSSADEWTTYFNFQLKVYLCSVMYGRVFGMNKLGFLRFSYYHVYFQYDLHRDLREQFFTLCLIELHGKAVSKRLMVKRIWALGIWCLRWL